MKKVILFLILFVSVSYSQLKKPIQIERELNKLQKLNTTIDTLNLGVTYADSDYVGNTSIEYNFVGDESWTNADSAILLDGENATVTLRQNKLSGYIWVNFDTENYQEIDSIKIHIRQIWTDDTTGGYINSFGLLDSLDVSNPLKSFVYDTLTNTASDYTYTLYAPFITDGVDTLLTAGFPLSRLSCFIDVANPADDTLTFYVDQVTMEVFGKKILVQANISENTVKINAPMSVGDGGVYLVNTWMDTMNVSCSVSGGDAQFVQTKTITGVAVGDIVNWGANVGSQPIDVTAFVSATNTVTLIIGNFQDGGGDAVELTNVNFNILVRRYVKP